VTIPAIIGAFVVGFGAIFLFLGALGIFRLPDVYNRLQAGTKCVTFGTAGLLFGVFVLQGFTSFGFKALLGIAFVFLTSPVAAHAISRAAHQGGVPLAEGSVVDMYQADKTARD